MARSTVACWYFEAKGECSRGEDCRFTHYEKTAETESSTKESAEESRTTGDSGAHGNVEALLVATAEVASDTTELLLSCGFSVVPIFTAVREEARNPKTAVICKGTGLSTFFPHKEQAVSDGIGGNNTYTDTFENIYFLQPYEKFSAEELCIADYSRGRRYAKGKAPAIPEGINFAQAYAL
jgi:hypothetical protein